MTPLSLPAPGAQWAHDFAADQGTAQGIAQVAAPGSTQGTATHADMGNAWIQEYAVQQEDLHATSQPGTCFPVFRLTYNHAVAPDNRGQPMHWCPLLA